MRRRCFWVFENYSPSNLGSGEALGSTAVAGVMLGATEGLANRLGRAIVAAFFPKHVGSPEELAVDL